MGAKRKLAALLVVATTGVTAALIFRKDGEVQEVQRGGTEKTKSTGEIDRRVEAPSRPAAKAAHKTPTAATASSARTGFDDPPELAAGYAGAFSRASAVSPLDDDQDAADAASRGIESPRTHVIVDGDTLPSLAQRYLHSPERHREIFELNRDVLADPELLPIGRSLRIPPTSGPRGAPLVPPNDEPQLVPIPKEKLHPGAGRMD